MLAHLCSCKPMNNPQTLFPQHIFRAYDIRGKETVLTAKLVHAIAQGLVQQYQQEKQTQISIGYDARLNSPAYAEIMRQVFLAHQFQVTMVGCCSSPMLYFMARHTAGNGIMLTASHNPKSDNGIKWIVQGEPPTPEMIQHVAHDAAPYYLNTDAAPSIASQHATNISHEFIEDACQQYQQAMLNDIQLAGTFKVVLDGMYGSAGHCAALVLQKMGCEVIALRCEANGHFPEHAPDPSQEKHLQHLKAAVREHQADIGIALDGDGDRVVLLDEHANVLSADRLLSLFAEMCLKTHPQHQVVFDVKCSTMVRNTVRDLGGEAVMIRTGSTFLRRYLAQSQGKAVFGGEYAGHYVFNDGRGFGYDDGIYAALRVLEYLSHSNYSSLSALMQKYPERCCTEDTYISTRNIEPSAVLNDVESSSHRSGAELSKIDGVRLDFEDGFGIIRASNTGEYFTVRFDADNPSRLNDIRDTFVSMLSERYPEIAQDILDAQ